jgi:iron(III) transport system substrate-binding protein
MRRLARGVGGLVVAGVVALTLSACGSASGPSLVVYSGQHEQTTNALVTAFEKATGITVDVRYDDEDVLAYSIVT